MTFDPTKPVQTRNGLPARIICANVLGDYPIIALILEDGEERAHTYTAHGSFFGVGSSKFDLVNIPERKEVYFNWYGYKGAHPSRADADKNCTGGRKGVLKIVIENDKPVSIEYEEVNNV